MTIGASEAETFWTEFLRALTRRGLRGVKLVISDAHVPNSSLIDPAQPAGNRKTLRALTPLPGTRSSPARRH